MCLRDARFKNFKDSILGMITASLYDGPVYFSCYLDLTLALDDPNIIKALTLNIASASYHMEEDSKPFALIYRIYYRLLGTQINPSAINHREPSGKTMLIKCSTPDAKVQIPKMIQWQDIRLPIFDELDLTHIQQYLDGTIKISFQNNQPLRINEGRHSFAGSEIISKRDQDLNEFLKRNLEKLADLKLKGVSNDKVSSVYYSTKPKTSSPYSKPTSEEEDDDKSVCPSDSNFPPIDYSDYVKQLRVLTVLNENFKVDLTPLYDEFMLSKNRTKRKYFQDNFA